MTPLLPSGKCVRCNIDTHNHKWHDDATNIDVKVWCEDGGSREYDRDFTWRNVSLCDDCEKKLFEWIGFNRRIAIQLLSE